MLNKEEFQMGSILIGMSVFSFLGEIETWQIIIFIIGILLMVVEMFTPGFGIAGGSGIALILIGIFLTAESFLEGMIMFGILVALVIVLLLIVLRSARKGKLKKIVLHSASRKENGYSATSDSSSLLGREGVAITILRPAGTGDFDGLRLDIVTEGSFIPPGSRIRIVRTEGRRIVVEKIG